jgi:hypothetical protein
VRRPNLDGTRRKTLMAADCYEAYNSDMLNRLAGMYRGTLNAEKMAVARTPARHEKGKENSNCVPRFRFRMDSIRS